MLSTMRTSIQFPLLLLPDELIALIIENVDDWKTLRNLARTCHQLQDIAESKLYRTLLIRSDHTARMLKNSLGSRPKRVKGVRKLECPLKDTERQDYDSLQDLCIMATGLREIMFESPACNTAEFEDPAEWEFMTRRLFCPFQRAAMNSEHYLSQTPLQQLREGEFIT